MRCGHYFRPRMTLICWIWDAVWAAPPPGLHRRWPGGALIVDGLSCTAPAGMVTGLVGPNGAGKTTLLRRIARLRGGSGAVLIGGEDTARWSRERAARTTAIVMQEATT